MTTYAWDTIKALPLPPPGAPYPLALPWAVAANQDGHLEIFQIAADGVLWHIWQTGADFAAWSEWAAFESPPGGLDSQGFVYAVPNQDGRLEVFARAANDSSILHIWQVAPNVNWVATWSSLGFPSSVPSDGVPNVQPFYDGGGRLQLLAQHMETGEVYSRGQIVPNGNWEADWTSLGAPPPAPCSPFVISPIGKRFLNRIYLTTGNQFASSALPVYVCQKSKFAAGSGNWSGWSESDWTTPAGIEGVRLYQAATNLDKRIEMFALDEYQAEFWHTWQNDQDAWTGEWSNLGRPPNSPGDQGLLTFDVARDSLGCLQLVMWQAKTDGTLHSIGQTTADNGWGTWTPIGKLAPHFGSLKVMNQVSGLLMVVVSGPQNQMFYIVQTEQP